MARKVTVASALAALVICTALTASAETGYFWHVTDFHYDPTYWSTQLSCNNVVLEAGVFGDYWCDANWRLVSDSIENMAAIKSDVDFIIWTGDSVAHISDDDASLEQNLEILQNITDELKKWFPKNGMRFFPSLGNHDFYPSNQADVKQDEFYNKTAKMWTDWINDADQVDQFLKGGFYAVTLNTNVRLLSLNTNLYYNHNRITKGMSDPAGQFAWMQSVLTQAKKNGQKVIVTAHIPPGVLTPNYATWMYPDHQKQYVAILTNYSDIILASHYGHDHSDGFKIIQEEMNDSKAIPQFTAPSVTPWRFKAGGLTGKPHNPAIRLVQYDKQTGEHLNYMQYFINLTETNMNNKTSWEKLYSFTDLYNVTDMSVESLRKIFESMANDEGELAQKYCNNALVSKQDKICTERNRYEIICGGQYYELEEAKKCVDKNLIGSAPFVAAHVMCIFISFLLTAINMVS